MSKPNPKTLDMDVIMESLDDAKKAIYWFLEDANLNPSDDAKLNSIAKLANSIYYARLVFWERDKNKSNQVSDTPDEDIPDEDLKVEAMKSLFYTINSADKWKMEIRKGNCFIKSTPYGFDIYGEVLREYEAEHLSDYRFCDCYSIVFPRGQKGDVHVSSINTLLERETYRMMKENLARLSHLP